MVGETSTVPRSSAPPSTRMASVHDGVVKRVAGREQLGAGPARRATCSMSKVTRSYRVAIGPRAAGAKLGGDVGDLEAAVLAPADLAAESGERGAERPLDVVGLQASRPRFVHRARSCGDVRVAASVLAGERALGEQLLEPVARRSRR